MRTQIEIYRSIRQHNLAIPAIGAWRQAEYSLEIERWAETVGFSWNDGVRPRYACWSESGYVLEALLEFDEAGWDLHGADDIGRFTATWQPGSIAHHRRSNRVLKWFVPADVDCTQVLYKRACSYGHDWNYVVLSVTASRAGVLLGEDVLSGLESDDGKAYFTETVFDLKHAAIEAAESTRRELCHC